MNKKYDVIYIDPPWFFNKRNNKNTKFGGGAEKHYNLMTDCQLMDFKLLIDSIASDNCIMFIWTTPPRLEFALQLINHYGFKYKTKAFTWIKTTSKGYRYNCGFYTSSNSEDLLICTKGKKTGFAKPDKPMINQIIAEPIREHSRKPDIVRKYIELMYPNYSKLEIFSRCQPYNDNWDVFGNETGKFNE